MNSASPLYFSWWEVCRHSAESETPESSSLVCSFYIKKELAQKGKEFYPDATLLKSLQFVLGPGGTT